MFLGHMIPRLLRRGGLASDQEMRQLALSATEAKLQEFNYGILKKTIERPIRVETLAVEFVSIEN